MEMPNVLVSGWFVVLSRGHAFAIECKLHGNGNPGRTRMDQTDNRSRRRVDVFIVLVGDNQCVTGILRPLPRRNEARDVFCSEDDVACHGVDVLILDAAND